MFEDLDLINEICYWLFTVCSLILLYFGTLVFTKVRRERKWSKKYKPSLDTMTEYDVKSHDTLQQYRQHGKERDAHEALQEFVEAARHERERLDEQISQYDSNYENLTRIPDYNQQGTDIDSHYDSSYYPEFDPDDDMDEDPQQVVRFVDKEDK
jgi:hypothetical protein